MRRQHTPANNPALFHQGFRRDGRAGYSKPPETGEGELIHTGSSNWLAKGTEGLRNGEGIRHAEGTRRARIWKVDPVTTQAKTAV